MTWPVAFSLRSSRSVDQPGQRPLLLAQRLLDPLHGVGQRRLGQPAARSRRAAAHQDDGQRRAQRQHHGQQNVDQDIHCQPL